MMQTTGSASSHLLSQLIQRDISLSLNSSLKILPSYMLEGHYSILVSWMFETMEGLAAQPEALFRAKQILDLFLREQEALDTGSYQLAAATAMKIALKSVQDSECPVAALVVVTGGVHSAADFQEMEARVRAVTAPHLPTLHSPYQYCSDELVAGLLPGKFAELLPLLVAYVATHPLSFGVNSLSIFLAALKYVGESDGGSVPFTSLGSCPMVLADCDRIGEVLAELPGDTASD